MSRSLLRVALMALVGAFAGAVALMVIGGTRPSLVLEMDGQPPPFVTGVYAGERDGERTFAWTRERVVVRLPGLDRGRPWTCTLRLRGARSQEADLPTVGLGVDGVATRTLRSTNDFADVRVDLPARPGGSGALLTMTSVPTFKPGGADPRELGVQLDQLRCEPEGGRAWPAPRALAAAAAVGAAFGGAATAAGVAPVLALGILPVLASGHAILLTRGGASFGPFPSTLSAVGVWTALLLGLCGVMARRHSTARAPTIAAALTVAAVAFDLKLLALLHPSKATVDALFQAHRLEWVMAGRYFFTQPMPDGVSFPYAIGLYLTAQPWTRVFDDHVALLRGVVMVAEALAAIGVSIMILREWRDRAAAVLAVAIFALVPFPYVVVGNGNLTNAFGQSVAVVVLAYAAWGAGAAWFPRALGLALIVTLALLSHVSTVALLLPALALVSLGFWWIERSTDGRSARMVIVAACVASTLAVGLYYRHFTDVYREALTRVMATTGPAAPVEAPAEAAAVLTRQLSWAERAEDAGHQAVAAFTWPLLVLAVIGAWRLLGHGLRDRLSVVVLAWLGVWLAMVLAGTLRGVDTQYQRYASEFMGRVNLATYPAIVVLAASAASGLWRLTHLRWAARGLALFLLAAAVREGWLAWLAWTA